MKFIGKHLPLFGIFLVTILVGAAVGFYFELPAHPQTPPPATGAPETYTCPMHPEVGSHVPGDCPKCGMALVAARPISTSHADCEHQGPSDGCCPKPAPTQMRLPPGHPPIPMQLPAGHPPIDGWQTNPTSSSTRKPNS